jgi:hypothetical protein
MANPAANTAAGASAAHSTTHSAPERISDLAGTLTGRVTNAITEITQITSQTQMLSLNAQIEAARAGGATGAAFAVVASAMQDLSKKTSTVARGMAEQVSESIKELSTISRSLATDVRGTRLSDLALANIDVIDRRLYERSCDCRWWATDASALDALTLNTPAATKFCSDRLGVILNAYTVYLDLVLCDLKGNVIANGRPNKFHSVGSDCSREQWFTSSMATKSGDEFGFQSVHSTNLAGGQRVLIYSAAVREKAESKGKIIGALGLLFNWDGLAQKIVTETPLSPEEKPLTRVCVVDQEGLVLADTHNRQLIETLRFDQRDSLFQKKKGYIQSEIDRKPCCIAHGLSPGFETYATGWHCLIIQSQRAPKK